MKDMESAANRFYMKCLKNFIYCSDEYQGKNTHLTVQHLTCKTEYKIQPSRYMYGEYSRARCPKCSPYVNKLLRHHARGRISSHDLLGIVKSNGWETRLDDLEYELLDRDFKVYSKNKKAPNR
ncbi:hypothetical protein J2Z48_002983 [Croceifilum oryzae]|uniref:Uncharacterized protein n=1 Tax=Croceifilum oryzae TaxID=1553429 RepID=A0AAJ1THU8_9BACL|nr:hypothetical protein [Croceifilum oryzae]